VRAEPERASRYLLKRIEASAFECKVLTMSQPERNARDQTMKRPSIVLNSADKIHTLDADLPW